MNISFAWTLEPLLAGKKTVTRRKWAKRTIKRWQRAWDNGPRLHDAYDKLPCWGGKKIGYIGLTARPYMERLADMPESDVEAEGGLWDSLEEYQQMMIEKHGLSLEDKLCVVRFKFIEKEGE